MDLFGFVKDIGRRVFNTDEEAAEKIEEYIEKNNPGVKNLSVEYDRGFVSLTGVCESGAAHQKAVLMAGNCEGVKDVDARNLLYPKAAPAAAGGGPTAAPSAAGVAPPLAADEKMEFYTIQSGDTLSKLAKKYYGDAMMYPRIFEANREVIEDADKIFVGQKIRIPID